MQYKLYKLQYDNNLDDEDMAKIIGKCKKQYVKKLKGLAAFNQDEMFDIARYFKLTLNDIFLDRVRQNGAEEMKNTNR